MGLGVNVDAIIAEMKHQPDGVKAVSRAAYRALCAAIRGLSCGLQRVRKTNGGTQSSAPPGFLAFGCIAVSAYYFTISIRPVKVAVLPSAPVAEIL